MSGESLTIKTGVDRLVDLIKEEKRVSIEEAARILSVPKVLVEEWADFLEEKEIIGVEYKFATPYLVYKELTKEDVEERQKEFSARKEGFARKVDSVLKSLDTQGVDFSGIKAEIKELTRELDSKAGNVKKELDLLSQYEQMKREIDGDIMKRQLDMDEKRKSLEKQILLKKNSIHSILKRMDAEQSKLVREQQIAELLKKTEAQLEKKLADIVAKAQSVDNQIKSEDSVVSVAAKKISDFRQISESAKVELMKQERELGPMLEESRKHEQKIAELRKRFFEKVSLIGKTSNRLSADSARETRMKFKKLFDKKEEAERMVDKLTVDLNGLKSELKELLEEAMVMQATSKSKRVSDYVKEFEAKFTALSSKREKFQGEVAKLNAVLGNFKK
jgi:hypothetical protein